MGTLLQSAALLAIAFAVASATPEDESPKKTLLIMLDGSGLPLLDDTIPHKSEAVRKFAMENVVFSNGMKGQSNPSLTANIVTTVTGMLPDVHNFAADVYYSQPQLAYFDPFGLTGITAAASESTNGKWWKPIEAIWETASKKGAEVAVVGWPLSKASALSKVSFDLGRTPEEGAAIVSSLIYRKDFLIWYVNSESNKDQDKGVYYNKVDMAVNQLFESLGDDLVEMNVVIVGSHPDPMAIDASMSLCMDDVLGEPGKDFHFSSYGYIPIKKDKDAQLLAALEDTISTRNLPIIVTHNKNISADLHISAKVGEVAVLPTNGASIRFLCASPNTRPVVSPSIDQQREGRILLVAGGPIFARTRQVTEMPGNEDVWGLLAVALDHEGPFNATTPIEFALRKTNYVPKVIASSSPLYLDIIFIVIVVAVLVVFALGGRYVYLRRQVYTSATRDDEEETHEMSDFKA